MQKNRLKLTGGKIVAGVSSKLNYLVVGEDAGSKLEKAKKIPAIKIISEEEFLKNDTNLVIFFIIFNFSM